jgi:hypothetical protein
MMVTPLPRTRPMSLGAPTLSPLETGMSGVQSFLAPRSNMLLGIGAGLLSGDLGNVPLMAMQGRQADTAYAEAEQAKSERQRALQDTQALRSKYADFFRQQNEPELADLVASDQGPPPGDLYWKWRDLKAGEMGGGSSAPASVREWEYYNALPPEQQGQYLRMKRANPYLDIGTGFVQPDPVNPGQTAGPAITKDNFTPAYDKTTGAEQAKADAEATAAYESLSSKMPGLRAVVSELGELAKKATYTMTGQLFDNIMRETGQMPSEGAQARTKYMAMVDNQVLPLLRDTFGAAFTVQEGESLRATLGAPDKSPVEKQAVLEAFIEQKARDLEAMQRRLPGQSPSAPPPAITDVDTILNGYGL